MNPNVDQLYRRKVKRLAEELAQHRSIQEPAIALRSLIGELVLTPAEKRGVPSAHVGHAEIPDTERALNHVELAPVATHPEADIHRCHTEIAPGY